MYAIDLKFLLSVVLNGSYFSVDVKNNTSYSNLEQLLSGQVITLKNWNTICPTPDDPISFNINQPWTQYSGKLGMKAILCQLLSIQIPLTQKNIVPAGGKRTHIHISL